jgi:hypothetical protein
VSLQIAIAGCAKCSTKTSFQIINIYSISGQNRASELATQGMWIPKNYKVLLEYVRYDNVDVPLFGVRFCCNPH